MESRGSKEAQNKYDPHQKKIPPPGPLESEALSLQGVVIIQEEPAEVGE